MRVRRPSPGRLAAGALGLVAIALAPVAPALASTHHHRHHHKHHVVARPATISLTVTNTVGDPALALAGVRVVARGTVTPFVPDQKVVVRFYRDKQKLLARRLAVRRLPGGGHGFEIGFTSAQPGLLSIHATHYATPRQAKAAAAGVYLRVVAPDLQPGDSGRTVTALQQSLAKLHFAVDQSGVYDLSTEQALIAYCRVAGIPLASSVDGTLFGMIARGDGSFDGPRPAGRTPFRGRPHAPGAGRDLAARQGAAHLHDQLRQAVDADRRRALRRLSEDPGRQRQGDGRRQLLHRRLCDPRLRGRPHLPRQPWLPAHSDTRRLRGVPVGDGRDAGRRLLRERRRRHDRQLERGRVAPRAGRAAGALSLNPPIIVDACLSREAGGGQGQSAAHPKGGSLWKPPIGSDARSAAGTRREDRWIQAQTYSRTARSAKPAPTP